MLLIGLLATDSPVQTSLVVRQYGALRLSFVEANGRRQILEPAPPLPATFLEALTMVLDPQKLPLSRTQLGGQLTAVRVNRHPVFPWATLVLVPDDEEIVTYRELIFAPAPPPLPPTGPPSDVSSAEAGLRDGLEVSAEMEGAVFVELAALFAQADQERKTSGV
jgi:hypothetical protein